MMKSWEIKRLKKNLENSKDFLQQLTIARKKKSLMKKIVNFALDHDLQCLCDFIHLIVSGNIPLYKKYEKSLLRSKKLDLLQNNFSSKFVHKNRQETISVLMQLFSVMPMFLDMLKKDD